jgi:FkbM family methyltransferase
MDGVVTTKALDCLNALKRQYVNTQIDWELILEKGYRLFLDRDSTVIDIGGHAGRHADVFVSEIGCRRILIFEPLPAQCEALRERYRLRERVEVHQLALASESGESDFVFNLNAPEESGLKERRYNDPDNKRLESIRVRVATLDELDLGLDTLDYVKIDTEGAEVDIIKGGEATIRRCRPVLSIEYGESSYAAYGKQRHTLYDLMTELDYRLFDLFGNPMATAEEWHECVDNFYWDFYAVPAERAQVFEGLLGDRILRELHTCVRR